VETLIINDLNPGIAAFWRLVFGDADRLLDRIENCSVSIENWHNQRALYLNPVGKSDLDLGFATFFLNRTNRSGILNARPIGGLEQSGKWLIDARFNKKSLMARIELLRQWIGHVDIREKRAIDLIRQLNRRKRPILMYVDPPYVAAGEELYMTDHSWREHERLAHHLSASPHPWILTYDADHRTRTLYGDFRCLQFSISHTAQAQRVGSEYMFFGRRLRVPDRAVLRTEGAWVPGLAS
jgi:DNA adenine methylase